MRVLAKEQIESNSYIQFVWIFPVVLLNGAIITSCPKAAPLPLEVTAFTEFFFFFLLIFTICPRHGIIQLLRIDIFREAWVRQEWISICCLSVVVLVFYGPKNKIPYRCIYGKWVDGVFFDSLLWFPTWCLFILHWWNSNEDYLQSPFSKNFLLNKALFSRPILCMSNANPE